MLPCSVPMGKGRVQGMFKFKGLTVHEVFLLGPLP